MEPVNNLLTKNTSNSGGLNQTFKSNIGQSNTCMNTSNMLLMGLHGLQNSINNNINPSSSNNSSNLINSSNSGNNNNNNNTSKKRLLEDDLPLKTLESNLLWSNLPSGQVSPNIFSSTSSPSSSPSIQSPVLLNSPIINNGSSNFVNSPNSAKTTPNQISTSSSNSSIESLPCMVQQQSTNSDNNNNIKILSLKVPSSPSPISSPSSPLSSSSSTSSSSSSPQPLINLVGSVPSANLTTKPIIQSILKSVPVKSLNSSSTNNPSDYSSISLLDLSNAAASANTLTTTTTTCNSNESNGTMDRPPCPNCLAKATRKHDKRRWWCKVCSRSFTPFKKIKKPFLDNDGMAPLCCKCCQPATRKHDKRRWWCKHCKKPFTPTQFNNSGSNVNEESTINTSGSHPIESGSDDEDSHNCNETIPKSPKLQTITNNNTSNNTITTNNLSLPSSVEKFKEDCIQLIYHKDNGLSISGNNLIKKENSLSNSTSLEKSTKIESGSPNLTSSLSSSTSSLKSSNGTNGTNTSGMINSLLNPIEKQVELLYENPQKRFKACYDLPMDKEDEETLKTLSSMSYKLQNKFLQDNNNNNKSDNNNKNNNLMDIDLPINKSKSPLLTSTSILPPPNNSSTKLFNHINITNSYDIINNDEYSRTTGTNKPPSSKSLAMLSSNNNNNNNNNNNILNSFTNITSMNSLKQTTTIPRNSSIKSPSEVILDHAIETLVQFNGEEQLPNVILQWFEKSNNSHILQKMFELSTANKKLF